MYGSGFCYLMIYTYFSPCRPKGRCKTVHQNNSSPMERKTDAKTCIACGKPVMGRADKKFCNDWCRNAYNNRDKSETVNHIRNINNILKKNRRILEGAIPEGLETGKILKTKMTEKGFSFKFSTHDYTTKKGHRYIFCYEYGYLPIEGGYCLVVKREAGL
jgi:predicted nucleic acid-binding Zn ribbon protein